MSASDKIPLDPTGDLPDELSDLATRLAGLAPAPAGIDPAVTFYRAGYAAAQAEIVAAAAPRGVWPKLAASWLAIAMLTGPASYMTGIRHGGAERDEWVLSHRDIPPQLAGGLAQPASEESVVPQSGLSERQEATGSVYGSSERSEVDVVDVHEAEPPQPTDWAHAPTVDSDSSVHSASVWERFRDWVQPRPTALAVRGANSAVMGPFQERTQWVSDLTQQIHDPQKVSFSDWLGSAERAPRGKPAPREGWGEPPPSRSLLAPLPRESFRGVFDERARRWEALWQ